MRTEIKIAGFGGQGIVTLSVLISFGGAVKAGGSIFTDPASVKIPENYREDVAVYRLPIQNAALDEFKTPLVANIIMFAAFVSITNILNKEIARRVVQDNVPKASLALNMKAFDRGIALAHRKE